MRETGPVRKELSGEEAAPYIGFARTVLGQLKNRMSLGGLVQGVFTRVLPDGAVVRVSSIFGQDKISILRPVAEVAAPAQPVFQPEIPMEEFAPLDQPWAMEMTPGGLVACGNFSEMDGPFNERRVPFRWTKQEGLVRLPLSGSYDQGEARTISGDGRTIGGRIFSANDNPVPVLWTAQGVEIISPALTNQGSIAVEALSALGDTALVYDLATAVYRWSRAGGLQLVSSSVTGWEPSMSRDGNLICVNPRPSGSPAVVYDRAGRVYTAPTNIADARSISDTGVVLLGTSGDGSFLWDIYSGALTPIDASFTEEWEISSDGLNVVGSTQEAGAGTGYGMHVRAGTATVLQGGQGSSANCVDAVAGHVVIGGSSGTTGVGSSAIWEYKNGGYELTEIPVSGGFSDYIIGITLVREPTTTVGGTNHTGFAKLSSIE